jgi:hypothetical protein
MGIFQPNVRHQNDFHWTVNGFTVVMFDAQHQADFADRSKIMPTRAITEPKPIGHKNNMPERDKSP